MKLTIIITVVALTILAASCSNEKKVAAVLNNPKQQEAVLDSIAVNPALLQKVNEKAVSKAANNMNGMKMGNMNGMNMSDMNGMDMGSDTSMMSMMMGNPSMMKNMMSQCAKDTAMRQSMCTSMMDNPDMMKMMRGMMMNNVNSVDSTKRKMKMNMNHK